MDLLQTERIPTVEELKAIFKANDYTTTVSRYDPQTASNEQNTVYLKAKKHFKLAWLGQMKGFGGKNSFRNFSNDYPVKVLETADENLVAGTVMEILADETLTDAIFDSVLASMEQPITEAIESYALSVERNRTSYAKMRLLLRWIVLRMRSFPK